MPGPFDPSSLLVLTFRGRNVGVLRSHCRNYDNVIEVAQGKFRPLLGVPAGDIVLLAAIPGYPLTDEIELSREIWSTVRDVVHSVTVALADSQAELPVQTSTSTGQSELDSLRTLVRLPIPAVHDGLSDNSANCRFAMSTPDPLVESAKNELYKLSFAGGPLQCTRYEDVIAAAQRNFRALQSVPVEDIILMGIVPGSPETGKVELSKEIWPMASTELPSVTIVLESGASPVARMTMLQDPLTLVFWWFPELEELEMFRISDRLLLPSKTSEPALLQKPVSHLHQIIETREGTQLDNDLTLADYNVASGDSIVVAFRPIAPVRFLDEPDFNQENLHVTVDLQLTPSWSFSAVYPSPQTTIPLGEHSTAQSLTWAVAAEPDGTLVEKTTGAEIFYLYWEAWATEVSFMRGASSLLVTPDGSRAASPFDDTEKFDPSRKVASYLGVVLKALALHTEARTSFITYASALPVLLKNKTHQEAYWAPRYWLPDLLKYEYIALRFLSQASYERAAEMHISPTPDVVTRVFMLFRGVAKSDIGLWEQAAARASAEDGGTFWARVLGVDAVRAADYGLFRVLEWGDTEVTVE
ncbi:hypothetical protein BC827DRAFT_1155940 [Russula dissimulans]|nr:hypothetical protein BC827DRAFT_1155940 [Russula dissimulans]